MRTGSLRGPASGARTDDRADARADAHPDARADGWTRSAPLALAAVLGVVAIGLGARVAQLTQENAAAVAAARGRPGPARGP